MSATLPPDPKDILAAAQEGRLVIQGAVPLADSLEWELGQAYFRERGSKAFIGDAIPVPFAINNDGMLSRRTAEVLFTSLVESEKCEPLEPVLYVLELGIGVGLFARFFLDAFQEICAREGKDYYQRLVYIAADRSERMLADACRHGVFANHPGRYLIRVVDALAPERGVGGEGSGDRGTGTVRLRAVFLNYVLDCLPAAHLKIGADPGVGDAAGGAAGLPTLAASATVDVQQLCVRTCLARHVPLGEFTHLTAADLTRMARSGSAADRRTLMELYGLFASEYDYRPIAADEPAMPHLDFAVRFARERQAAHLLHNYGAMQCLEGLLAILHPGGFIAINDYGQAELPKSEDFEHQRFSQSTAIGLNFPLLKEFILASGNRWVEPAEENGHIVSRLVGLGVGHDSIVPVESGEPRGGDGQRHDGIVPHRGVGHDCIVPVESGEPRGGDGQRHDGIVPHRGVGHDSIVPVESGEPRGGDGQRHDGIVPHRGVGHDSIVPVGTGEHRGDDGRRHDGIVPHRGVETVTAFQERFGKAAWEWGQERWNLARAYLEHGRVEGALTAYHQALDRQPGNWLLLNEIATFLTFTLRNPPAGVAMARAAVELNPACSSELWNTLGDAWYEMGKLAEAKSAYRRALRVNAGDVRGRFNLAWALNDERRYGEALGLIAEALALDETGAYYERLGKKQAEILGRLAQRNQHKQFLLANRVSSKAREGSGARGEGREVKG